jgi:transcriptional regulator with XRE-family HTH domain
MSAKCGKTYSDRVPSAWTYGTKLREMRERSELTQNEAASLVGVQLGTYGGWERGTQNPTLENLRAVAEAFRIDPRELGYEPPKGWELVPSDWIRKEFTALNEKLDKLMERT